MILNHLQLNTLLRTTSLKKHPLRPTAIYGSLNSNNHFFLFRTVVQNYDFTKRGFIELTLDLDRKVCSSSYDNSSNNMIWIPALNLIFATISMILIIKYFNDIVNVYNKMKRTYDNRKKAIESKQQKQRKLSVSLKMKYSTLQRMNSNYLS